MACPKFPHGLQDACLGCQGNIGLNGVLIAERLCTGQRNDLGGFQLKKRIVASSYE